MVVDHCTYGEDVFIPFWLHFWGIFCPKSKLTTLSNSNSAQNLSCQRLGKGRGKMLLNWPKNRVFCCFLKHTFLGKFLPMFLEKFPLQRPQGRRGTPLRDLLSFLHTVCISRALFVQSWQQIIALKSCIKPKVYFTSLQGLRLLSTYTTPSLYS